MAAIPSVPAWTRTLIKPISFDSSESGSQGALHTFNGTNLLKANIPTGLLKIASPTQDTALTQETHLTYDAHVELSPLERSLRSAPAYDFTYRQAEMVDEMDILAQVYKPTMLAPMTPMERFECMSPSTFPYHQHQAYIPPPSSTHITTWRITQESPYNGASRTLDQQASLLQTEAGSRDDFRLAQEVAGCFVDGYYIAMHGSRFRCYDPDFIGIGTQFENELNWHGDSDTLCFSLGLNCDGSLLTE